MVRRQESRQHVNVLSGFWSKRSQEQQAVDVTFFFEGIDDQLPPFVFDVARTVAEGESHMVVFKEASGSEGETLSVAD